MKRRVHDDDPPELLTNLDIEIVMKLWNALFEPLPAGAKRKTTFTREDLAKVLIPGTFNKPSAIAPHLTKLKVFADLVQTSKAPAHSHRPNKPDSTTGKKLDLYSISYRTAITWPSTAKIVMTVWHAGLHSCNEKLLIAEIVRLRLKRKPTEPGLLTKSGIIKDITFAISNEYLDRHGGQLRTMPRCEVESIYLQKIADRA
jgi:hypothetical protein